MPADLNDPKNQGLSLKRTREENHEQQRPSQWTRDLQEYQDADTDTDTDPDPEDEEAVLQAVLKRSREERTAHRSEQASTSTTRPTVGGLRPHQERPTASIPNVDGLPPLDLERAPIEFKLPPPKRKRQ